MLTEVHVNQTPRGASALKIGNIYFAILAVLIVTLGLQLTMAPGARANEADIGLPPTEAVTSAQLEETESTEESQETQESRATPGAPDKLPAAPGSSGTAQPSLGSPGTPSPDQSSPEKPMGWDGEALVPAEPPPESKSPMAGLVWFGAVFVVLVCVIYLFL
jgi:hypothetical protein